MLRLLFGKAVGFIMPNKWLWIVTGLLLTTTTASAYLLKSAYIDNGKQKYLTNQWIASSKHWNDAYEELDARLLQREKERNRAWAEMGKLKDKLRTLQDENDCLDSDTPNTLRMLFIRPETDD